MGLESLKIGHGGGTLLAQITGLHVETIRRGLQELENDLQDRTPQRIRRAGAGHPPVEKKIPPSNRT